MRKRRRRPKLNTGTGEGQFFPGVQKKLKVGQPDDAFEVEADKMADTVVNGNEGGGLQKKEAEEEVQQKPLAAAISDVQKKDMPADEEPVQKKDAPAEEEPIQKMEEEEEAVQQKEEEEPIQKMEEEEAVQQKEEEESVQKKSANTPAKTPSATEAKLNQQKGKGSKMDASTKKQMEKGFGADFSNITIHTDSVAEELSSDLGAQAFTHGNDVYFNTGKYNPNSKEGKHLLAHELTHTIQQKGKTAQKVQKQRAVNPDHTSFSGTFANQLAVPFFSTEEKPKIRVVINHTALLNQVSNCASFNVRIDNAARTLRPVNTDITPTRTVLNFEMQNAQRHTLYLLMPNDCRGIHRIRASGTITRHR